MGALMQIMPPVHLEAATKRSAHLATAEAVNYRWKVWKLQQSQGNEPCFRTEQRHVCATSQCPWRHECQVLVAEWQI